MKRTLTALALALAANFAAATDKGRPTCHPTPRTPDAPVISDRTNTTKPQAAEPDPSGHSMVEKHCGWFLWPACPKPLKAEAPESAKPTEDLKPVGAIAVLAAPLVCPVAKKAASKPKQARKVAKPITCKL